MLASHALFEPQRTALRWRQRLAEGLLEGRRVGEAARAARERASSLDVGHGMNSFCADLIRTAASAA